MVIPTITMAATGASTRPITAAEAAAHTMAKTVELYAKLSYRNAHYPADSVRAAVAATSAQWLMRLQQSVVRGIQLDPSGYVGVAAEQEGYAQAQIAARLATPGLSVDDRAYTLTVAVEAFSDRYASERLHVAETYLKDLDALGDAASMWQFEARQTLLHTYYLLGRGADVVRHGTRAIALLSIMPFPNRNVEFGQSEEEVYHATIEALTGQLNARAQIERLNATLRAAAVPSPELIAIDSAYYWLGYRYQRSVGTMIMGNAKLGTLGASLVAHHWINRPAPDSADIPVNDGTIHVVEVAHTGCVPCVYELYALQRLHEQFPDIAPMLVTWTMGWWGNRLVEPAEEVAHLTDYFVTNTKVTIPVGIWAGKKVPNEDGGMIPEEGPNAKNYPIFGKPMLWVLDGHGTIRRVFTEYSRDIESQIVRTIEFLRREANSTALHPADVRLVPVR